MDLGYMGYGLAGASFKGEETRLFHLRLDVEAEGKQVEIMDNILFLPDRHKNMVAFQHLPGKRATRIPVTPTPWIRISLAPSTTYVVAFGWGILVFLYLGFLVLTIRGNRRSESRAG